MNSSEYVDQQIAILKTSGIPLSDAAWQTALLCVGWPYIYGDRGTKCTIAHRQQVYNKGPDKNVYQNVRAKCQAIRESNPTGSCSGCKWYPNGKRVLAYDCRGFPYWILLQIYGWKLMGAGATSQWNNADNWTAQGTIDTVPEDMLVCLFQQDAKDPKVMAHTGLGYHGETIECQSGVQYKKARESKWTHWGIPKCVSDVPPEPDPSYRPTLRRGDQGAYVTLAQTELINRGYDLGSWGADGKFGAATEKAVRQFQQDWGLSVDGIIGPKTWAMLDSTPVKVTYKVTIPHLSLADAEALAALYDGAVIVKEGDA